MKTAVVTITYNTPNLLIKQVELINRFCLDAFDLWVVDNSTDPEAIEGIKHHAERLGCNYMKTQAANRGGSLSHAFAANASYLDLKDQYDYFLYLDHDCFPIKNFSVSHELGDKVIAGIGQNKTRTYFWPGCVMFKQMEIIEFSCNSKLGLDTGGNLYKVIDAHGLDKCKFFNEIKHENGEFQTESMYNYYTTINDHMFFHMTNASNWNPTERHEERVNSLLNILDTWTKE